MTGKHRRNAGGLELPSPLASVALIDATACAAIGGMSVSWWNEQVRAGRAPQPAIRAPRMTRWHLAQAIDFWGSFVQRADVQTAERVLAQATKASAAAKRKRSEEG